VHFSVGDRIAFYHRRRQLTQRVLAELVGRSEDWLSKVERNERDIRRLDILAEVARALRVSVGDLLGQPVVVEDQQQKDDDVPAVRDALMSHRRLSQTLFGSRAVEAVAVEQVARFSRHAWTHYKQGQLGRVVTALPNLIRSAQALEETAALGDQRPWVASARIHHLAATTLVKFGEADLAWIAAERAMSAAERSGDPLSLASAARAGAHALLAVGRFDDAVNLGQTASEWLANQIDQQDPAALSLAGMLYLRTAIAAAERQDRSTTTTLIAAADRAASQLGRDADYWQTSFGPTNVQLHRVATSLDLGDIPWVIEHGSQIDASHLPAERSVAYQIDLARAYSYVARDDDALAQLLAAEAVAPQIVRHSARVRDTVKMLHRCARHSAGNSSPLLDLAMRCRAIQ
jgi:transcriptional regulator with XRE-family HTH domain